MKARTLLIAIAAVLATGANQIGDAVTSLGSTLVLKIISDKPVFAPESGIYSHHLGQRCQVFGRSRRSKVGLHQICC